MKILITAGNTAIPIDQVRQINNLFHGSTGAQIAKCFSENGLTVTLLTSQDIQLTSNNITIKRFRTFDELAEKLEHEVQTTSYDAIVHSAAVSDYRVAGTYTQPLQDAAVTSKGKISSDHETLWLKLVKTPKLIDHIKPWGFQGVLVKFKLQVGMSDQQLCQIAESSRKHSQADLIVANCLEWYKQRAYIIGAGNTPESVKRSDLPERLLKRMEELL